MFILFFYFLFSLEFCCDYVRVYDGPTDQAPLLGQVPGNQGNSFNSSSRYMTVIFSSDNSWSQQGFRAEWAFIGTFQLKIILTVFKKNNNCME